MALKKCRRCSKEVNYGVKVCPRCRIRNPIKSGMINIIIAAAFVVIFLFVVGSQSNHNEKQKPEYVKIKEDLRKDSNVRLGNCM